jgi:hypothetical protein
MEAEVDVLDIFRSNVNLERVGLEEHIRLAHSYVHVSGSLWNFNTEVQSWYALIVPVPPMFQCR